LSWSRNAAAALRRQVLACLGPTGELPLPRNTYRKPRSAQPEIERLEIRMVPSTVKFSSASYSIGEAGGSINITLSALDVLSTVTVDYSVISGSATYGSDYTLNSGTLTFTSSSSQTFTVTVINDSLDEDDETVNLALSNPMNATLGSPSGATLTIVDDDPLPTVSFNSSTYSV